MKFSKAPLFVLLAAMLWGTTGTSQALAPATAHPIAIGAIRLAISGLFLLPLVFMSGKFQVQHWPIRITIFASICMAFYQPLFFSAVSITGVAIGTVVAIGSAPIFSGLTEWIFLKIRPPGVWWISTSLAIIGCILLFVNKEYLTVNPIGILLALGAGLSFSSYTIVSRELVQKYDSLTVIGIVFTISAIFLSPFLFFFDMSWLFSYRGIGVSLHLGIIATAVAYFLFAKGLTRISSSRAVTLSLAEPLTASLLGVFLLGEFLNLTSWFGISFLLIGIGILIFDSKQSNTKV